MTGDVSVSVRQKCCHLEVKSLCGKKCVLAQVSHFQYLGCDIAYGCDKDVGFFRLFVEPLDSQLAGKRMFYKVMTVPTLLYGSGTWVPTGKDLN